jgi:O-antigen/teichoic acid export membrane protein
MKARPAAQLAIVRRLGWGVADQGVSSLSNFALSLFVARALGAERFGAFSLAYITYTVVLNASRGLATDPLLVRHSGADTPAWRKAVGASTATAGAVGLIGGIVCIVVGFALPGDLRGAFIALGFGLPGLMMQDSWRFAFFAVGRGRKALVNDLVWTILLLGTLVVLLWAHHDSVVGCILAFGVTATLTAGYGMVQSGIRPTPYAVRGWVVEHRHLGTRYLVENVSISGARQIRAFALGAVAGLATVGDVRAAEILMGPFLVVLMGISQVAVPEASAVLARSPRRLPLFCFGLGTVQAVAAAVWGGLMVVILPLGLGSALLGPIWAPAHQLLVPVTIGICAACFSTGAAAGLRAMGAARRSLRAQLTVSVLYVIFGVGGAVVDDARGTCWGVATATIIGAAGWWLQLHRAMHEHQSRRVLPLPAAVTSDVVA